MPAAVAQLSHHVFNLSHRNLCHNATEIKGDLQRAFQTIFQYGHIPRFGQLLTHLGDAIYDIEDLEFNFEHFNLRYGRTEEDDGFLYVIVLDLQQFVQTLTELLEIVEDATSTQDKEFNEDRITGDEAAEIANARDQVRTAATNLKFITTPVKPGVNELFFNDQD